MKEKLIIISAPSGAGKSTIVKYLLDQELNLEFSVSATSRAPRGAEKDGTDYYFLSVEEFRRRIKNDAFVEWEEVYEDQLYGTLKSELDRIWSHGSHVLFDVDVKGGVHLKDIYKHQAISIFIMPPSIRELEKRLIARGTDADYKIKMRLEKAAEELRLADSFDSIVANNNLEEAEKNVYKLVKGFIDND
jgi:guanylate kinase